MGDALYILTTNYLARVLPRPYMVCTALFCTLLSGSGCGLFGSRYGSYELPIAEQVTPEELQSGAHIWNSSFQQAKLSYESPPTQRVTSILTKLLPFTGSQDRWLVHITSAREADLSVTPGNQIFLSSELLDILHDNDALAVVLAHAVGHAIAQEPAAAGPLKDFSQALSDYKNSREMPTTLSSSRARGEAADTLRTKARALMHHPWNSEAEEAADVLGSIYLVAAGMTRGQLASGWRIVSKLTNRTAPHLLTRHRTKDNREEFILDNFDDFKKLAQELQFRPKVEVAYFVSKRTSEHSLSGPPARSETVVAYAVEGQKALEINAFREAEEAFLKAVQEQPRDYLLRHYLAKVYYEAGKYQLAIDQFTQALSLNPFHAISYYYRACSYALIGQNRQALKELKQALLFAPHLRSLALEDKDFAHLHDTLYFERLVSNPAPSLIVNVPPALL